VSQKHLEMEFICIFLPIIGSIDARRAVWCIKSDTERRGEGPASNIENTPSLVRKHDCTGAEYVCLDMHCAPSKIKIRGETQVEFVCASRVGEFRGARFLEKGDFAIDTEGSNQWRNKARNEILREMAFQRRAHTE
jgi:hypothetical protein